jgi:hypothetical protein
LEDNSLAQVMIFIDRDIWNVVIEFVLSWCANLGLQFWCLAWKKKKINKTSGVCDLGTYARKYIVV